ncbi:MAG: acyl-CoA dehydrogenase family protein [Candidatus Competibacteraceae bacterium]
MTAVKGQASPLSCLLEEERLFQREVQKFAKEQLEPLVKTMDDTALLPRPLLEQLFSLGLMGIEIPTDRGGGGGSFFMSMLAIEALSRVDPAVAVVVHVQNILVNKTLLRWGNPAQRERWLPALAAGTVAAYALSESTAGSDAFSLTTRARRQGDTYLLSGRKQWITNAAEAGLFLLFANTEPEKGARGITAFLIEPSAAGFQVGKREDKLGIRASSTCELLLDEVPVPAECVLGKPGMGMEIVSDGLAKGRIGIAAQMVGLAQAALDAAVSYAQQRRQFGQSIAGFQGVRFPLAEVAARIEAARLLTYNAARLQDAGTPYFKLLGPAAMAKYLASQVAEQSASLAVDIFGGCGFSREYPVEKLYRDAKIGKIYEGTSNMQLLTIASTLMD